MKICIICNRKFEPYYAAIRTQIICNDFCRNKHNRKLNEKNIKIYRKKYIEMNPWYSSFNNARKRCSLKGEYFRKGIKFLMTIDDFKSLWFRDMAWKLNMPSIDRINSSGNYELSNCRFIEKTENDRLACLNRCYETSISTKLNRNQVIEIRKKYSSGKFTQSELAKEYGISQSPISSIIGRRSWKRI